MSDTEKLVTEDQLAKLWSVTTSFLQKMRHEGRGPQFIRIGRLVRYRVSDLIRYVEENRVVNEHPEGPTVDQSNLQ